MRGFSPEERQLLQDSVARFVTQEYGFEARQRGLKDPAPNARAAWRMMAELGWLGIGLAEDLGGAGGGAAETAIVMEGIGRGLVMEPYLSTSVLGAPLIAALGTKDQRAALGTIIAGDGVLALAHSEPQLGFARQPIASFARDGAGGTVLNGRKCFVLDGPAADTLLVSAIDAAGIFGIYLVSQAAAGLTMTPYRMVDARLAADLLLENVAGVRLGDGGDAFEALDAVLDQATVAVCAEAAGAMDSVIEATILYLKQRQQFGQPLAKFQVLQHRLVDMYVAKEETRAMLDMAIAALGAGAAERRAAVSALKVQTCRHARFVGQQGVQLHGGMGMTDELAISHYFKRLMTIEALFGNADFHLQRYGLASAEVDVAA